MAMVPLNFPKPKLQSLLRYTIVQWIFSNNCKFQFLKNIDKKVSLLIPSDSDILEDEIGDYIVKKGVKNVSMQIKHRDMDGKVAGSQFKKKQSLIHNYYLEQCYNFFLS